MIDPQEVARRQRLLDSLAAYRGREALYREGRKFARVRVDDIFTADDQIVVRLELIPTRGFSNAWDESWRVAQPWNRVQSIGDVWVNAWIGMKMDFDPGLIAAVVRTGEALALESRDEARFDQITNCIWKYRKKKLGSELVGEFTLICDDRPLGVVTEIFLFDFEVHGKFAPSPSDETDQAAELSASPPHRWRLASADGREFDCHGVEFQANRERVAIRHCSRREVRREEKQLP